MIHFTQKKGKLFTGTRGRHKSSKERIIGPQTEGYTPSLVNLPVMKSAKDYCIRRAGQFEEGPTHVQLKSILPKLGLRSFG